MDITSYTDFIDAARQQPEPQRLLFVFAAAELPENANADQQAGFASGQGGSLAPVMCVDKLPGELGGFAELVAESQHMGKHWDVVFAASLSGKGGVAPDSAAADQPFNMMIESIRQGNLSRFLAFDRDGALLQFF
ncbi:ribonucleotide reductase subunit alpha [Chitinivorax sp. PXF-14]|uniref:ribonucleotide reductase subunit alpha n=1 Tax=Chitinivorax sp. PXF-14 TaxID=3230488 RepID=UPI00346625F2